MSGDGYGLINIRVRCCSTGATPACLILSEYQGRDNCAACICADYYLPFVCAQARAVVPFAAMKVCTGTDNLSDLEAGIKEQSLPVSMRKFALLLRSRTKRRRELEGEAYVAVTHCRYRAAPSYSDVYKSVSTSGHWKLLLSSG
ncbi:hypothetical protein AVEN_168245-1 [Araneus ventricosus]|uniref:Uncharacterized protein n=1 Tax=Araneus ventricosus TaxID=182803 RepID=A0A4Y2J6K8_ARAVE|nr:hypothetical protein AVEN_168245-1 [Araneus ventricosus]